MRRLISKIQYKTFEQGEFVSEQERTCEEVIQLIKDFPWAEQRKGIGITLTTPSVTIQNEKGQFLKFAPYFKGKYVLYFLDYFNTLYKLSYVRMEDHFPQIEAFFSDEGIDISAFKKENNWQQAQKNFISQSFHYFVTAGQANLFFKSTSGVNVIFSLIFLAWLLFGKTKPPIEVIVVLLMVLFFLGGPLQLMIVNNYYRYARNKVLIMSRGNSSFYFGDVGNPVMYKKEDISIVYSRSLSGTYSDGNANFVVIEIVFKNGTSIKIPNILIEEHLLINKLSRYPHKTKRALPFV
jgi:hypothetical protein